MSYLVLARKYRPQKFEEVVGQNHVTTILSNAISQEKISHAYMFSGPRGVGKTTVARLLAKALNCKKGPVADFCGICDNCREVTEGTFIDMIEIDGASNRGIDEIRELKEQVRFYPAKGKYKVYIIDEVHMLTQEAFNALLKTLEEPPSHTVFIFATTEPKKVPLTISSRCQRFFFKKISIDEIIKQLKRVSHAENIKLDDEVLFLIANYADGALRDALSILDQLRVIDNKDIKECMKLLGITSYDFIIRFTDKVFNKNINEALKLLDELSESGVDIHQFVKDWLFHLRNLVVFKTTSDGNLLNISSEQIKEVKKQCNGVSTNFLMQAVKIIKGAGYELKYATQPRIIIEMAMANIAKLNEGVELISLIERLEKIEKSIKNKNINTEDYQSVENKIQSPSLTIEEIEDATDNNRVKNLWLEILSTIKQKRIPILYGVLNGSRILSSDSGSITVEVLSNFHKETLEKIENKSIVDEAVVSVFHKPMKIHWIVKKYSNSESKKKKNSSVLSENKQLRKEPLNKMVSEALKVFGGRLVE